jgi:hypothetical protein
VARMRLRGLSKYVIIKIENAFVEGDVRSKLASSPETSLRFVVAAVPRPIRN